MPPAGFGPAIQVSERAQILGLDSAATGIEFYFSIYSNTNMIAMKISVVLTTIALYYVRWKNFSSQKSSENLLVF